MIYKTDTTNYNFFLLPQKETAPSSNRITKLLENLKQDNGDNSRIMISLRLLSELAQSQENCPQIAEEGIRSLLDLVRNGTDAQLKIATSLIETLQHEGLLEDQLFMEYGLYLLECNDPHGLSIIEHYIKETSSEEAFNSSSSNYSFTPLSSDEKTKVVKKFIELGGIGVLHRLWRESFFITRQDYMSLLIILAERNDRNIELMQRSGLITSLCTEAIGPYDLDRYELLNILARDRNGASELFKCGVHLKLIRIIEQGSKGTRSYHPFDIFNGMGCNIIEEPAARLLLKLVNFNDIIPPTSKERCVECLTLAACVFGSPAFIDILFSLSSSEESKSVTYKVMSKPIKEFFPEAPDEYKEKTALEYLTDVKGTPNFDQDIADYKYISYIIGICSHYANYAECLQAGNKLLDQLPKNFDFSLLLSQIDSPQTILFFLENILQNIDDEGKSTELFLQLENGNLLSELDDSEKMSEPIEKALANTNSRALSKKLITQFKKVNAKYREIPLLETAIGLLQQEERPEKQLILLQNINWLRACGATINAKALENLEEAEKRVNQVSEDLTPLEGLTQLGNCDGTIRMFLDPVIEELTQKISHSDIKIVIERLLALKTRMEEDQEKVCEISLYTIFEIKSDPTKTLGVLVPCVHSFLKSSQDAQDSTLDMYLELDSSEQSCPCCKKKVEGVNLLPSYKEEIDEILVFLQS